MALRKRRHPIRRSRAIAISRRRGRSVSPALEWESSRQKEPQRGRKQLNTVRVRRPTSSSTRDIFVTLRGGTVVCLTAFHRIRWQTSSPTLIPPG